MALGSAVSPLLSAARNGSTLASALATSSQSTWAKETRGLFISCAEAADA